MISARVKLTVAAYYSGKSESFFNLNEVVQDQVIQVAVNNIQTERRFQVNQSQPLLVLQPEVVLRSNYYRRYTLDRPLGETRTRWRCHCQWYYGTVRY